MFPTQSGRLSSRFIRSPSPLRPSIITSHPIPSSLVANLHNAPLLATTVMISLQPSAPTLNFLQPVVSWAPLLGHFPCLSLPTRHGTKPPFFCGFYPRVHRPHSARFSGIKARCHGSSEGKVFSKSKKNKIPTHSFTQGGCSLCHFSGKNTRQIAAIAALGTQSAHTSTDQAHGTRRNQSHAQPWTELTELTAGEEVLLEN